MPGINNYTGFILAVLAFQIIPGPGTLAILNATARYGIGSGMAAVMGTLAGDLLFMLVAVLGLAAVLSTLPFLFSFLQWFGILYLCWLGLRLILSGEGAGPGKQQAQNHWASFRQALAVCLTNPKAILFFMAFFPLFLARDSEPVTLGLMVLHVSLISLLYQTGLVLAGNAIAVKFSRFPRARTLAGRLAGLGLLGFGLKLAMSQR
jgi:threonine/homoserine/homoserine lactone efflux protein